MVVYLEGLFIDVRVIPDVSSACLAEEYEILEEKNVTVAFLLPEGQQELILTDQLALFLQIHLHNMNTSTRHQSHTPDLRRFHITGANLTSNRANIYAFGRRFQTYRLTLHLRYFSTSMI